MTAYIEKVAGEYSQDAVLSTRHMYFNTDAIEADLYGKLYVGKSPGKTAPSYLKLHVDVFRRN